MSTVGAAPKTQDTGLGTQDWDNGKGIQEKEGQAERGARNRARPGDVQQHNHFNHRYGRRYAVLGFGGHGEVIGSATPSGPVAATTHYGPYGLLHKAQEAIRQWCMDHGHVLAGPNWEIYGHWQDEWDRDPSKITTDVFYLLQADGNSAA